MGVRHCSKAVASAVAYCESVGAAPASEVQNSSMVAQRNQQKQLVSSMQFRSPTCWLLKTGGGCPFLAASAIILCRAVWKPNAGPGGGPPMSPFSPPPRPSSSSFPTGPPASTAAGRLTDAHREPGPPPAMPSACMPPGPGPGLCQGPVPGPAPAEGCEKPGWGPGPQPGACGLPPEPIHRPFPLASAQAGRFYKMWMTGSC